MIVAVKNLVAGRARFVLSVIGVAVAVILVLVMSGIFVGTTNQVTTYTVSYTHLTLPTICSV